MKGLMILLKRSRAAGSDDGEAARESTSRANLSPMSESSALIWRDTARPAEHISRWALSAMRDRTDSGRSSASDASRMASVHESITLSRCVREPVFLEARPQTKTSPMEKHPEISRGDPERLTDTLAGYAVNHSHREHGPCLGRESVETLLHNDPEVVVLGEL